MTARRKNDSSADRRRVTRRPFEQHAATTNGSVLMAGIDGRSAAARRFKDLYKHYLILTHGRHEELCRQLASLIVRRECLDAKQVRGEDVDDFTLVRLANAINRTLAKLNLTADDAGERKRRQREDREAGLIT